MKFAALAFGGLMLMAAPAIAKEPLVLDIDMSTDMLSLADNIQNFFFDRTMSFSDMQAGDLNRRMLVDPLRDHLVVTFLVRIDGEVAGIATEQEIVSIDPESGEPVARSSWLFTLNHPKAKGVLAVAQEENAKQVANMIQQVEENRDKDWPDKYERFLSTSSDARVGVATEGLAQYQGAKFKEYNYLNPADLKNQGHFNGKLQFVIEPVK